MSAMSTPAEFLGAFQILSSPERCADWAARLQDTSQRFWMRLEDENVPSSEVKAFIALLEAPERLALARLVIPDLRDTGQTESLNKRKREVLDGLSDALKKLAGVRARSQADFDTPAYKLEKDIIHDAEMYRLKLLVYNDTKITAQEEERLNEWWEARPRPSRK
ncbi:hypothetical protein KCV07_g866, partial [Aureobasidium melanogenum]